MNKINWTDARIGDSALVTSENKMGVILKDYGRKFHLRFADGSEKTYDASELNFFNTDDDYERGGSIKKGDVYQWHTVEYDSKKGNNYKVVKNIEITDIDSKGQVIGRVVGTSNQFIIRDPQKNLKSKVSKMETGGDIERGGANMYIELKDSDIAVYHGSAYKLNKNAKPMFVISSAKKGSWDELWQSIRSIQSSNTDGQKGSAHLYVKLSNGDITVYHGDDVRQFRKLDEDERLFLQKNVRKDSWDKVYNTLMNLKSVKMENGGMARKTHFQPVIRKDKNNPNFLYIDIYYPEGKGILSIGQSKTMFGREREEGALKALQIANSFAKQLEEKYNIEDIEVNDLKNGMVQVFAVSDDFVKMGDNLLNNIKMENGGVVGQEIVFDDSGERNTGVIKEIHEITGDYIVAADDGRTVLAQKDVDVISLGKMRTKSGEGKKRFGFFEDGGNIAKENKEMIDSQTIEARHHVEELSKILTKKNKIEPWVVARMERATTDLSDVTHYLEGKKMAKGGRAGDYPSFKVTKIIRVDDEMITPGYYTYTGRERGGKGVYMNGQNYQTAGFDLDKIKRLKSLFPDSIEMVMETGGGIKHSYEITQEGNEFIVEFLKSNGELDWGRGGFSSKEEAEKYALENRKYATGGGVDELDEDEIDFNSISSLQQELGRLRRWANSSGSKGADAKIKQLEQRIDYLKSNTKMAKGGGIDDDFVIFSVDDDALDTLLNDNHRSELDYEDIHGDSYYKLNRRDFDRFIDYADSIGFDVDYENNEDAVVYVVNPRMATGGGVGSKLKATYIPNRNIDELKTVFGQSIKGKDLIDGAYTTRKGIKQKPKMARIMFEEETYEFSKGGGVGEHKLKYSLNNVYMSTLELRGVDFKRASVVIYNSKNLNLTSGLLNKIKDLIQSYSGSSVVKALKNENKDYYFAIENKMIAKKSNEFNDELEKLMNANNFYLADVNLLKQFSTGVFWSGELNEDYFDLWAFLMNLKNFAKQAETRDRRYYEKVMQAERNYINATYRRWAKENREAELNKDIKKYEGTNQKIWKASLYENGGKMETSGQVIQNITKQLDELGVKYKLSKSKVRIFDEIIKPINKEDSFYDKFDSIIDLYNLQGVVKTKTAMVRGGKMETGGSMPGWKHKMK